MEYVYQNVVMSRVPKILPRTAIVGSLRCVFSSLSYNPGQNSCDTWLVSPSSPVTKLKTAQDFPNCNTTARGGGGKGERGANPKNWKCPNFFDRGCSLQHSHLWRLKYCSWHFTIISPCRSIV